MFPGHRERNYLTAMPTPLSVFIIGQYMPIHPCHLCQPYNFSGECFENNRPTAFHAIHIDQSVISRARSEPAAKCVQRQPTRAC